jgi:hypothetical protein
MENKKSFVLYCDLLHTVKKLPNDKAGELFKHLLEYVNDLEPQTEDILIEVAFEGIKQSLKRDLLKWTDKKDVKSLNGKLGNLKRWNIDLFNKVEKGKITLEEAEKIAISRKVSGSDKKVAKVAVSVNDNVSVNDSVSEIKEIIDFLYKLYPTNCPFKSKSLGKCDKDKKKIEQLLKVYTSKEIEDRIQFYIKDCNNSRTWYKNFGTLLNNLPDITEIPVVVRNKPRKPTF